MAITSPRSDKKTLLPVPTDFADRDEHLRIIARAIRQLQELAFGSAIFTGSVTLGTSTTTTQVSDDRITASSKVFLFPTTANAASIDSHDVRISAVAAGSFTITHDNNAAADRTFYYALFNA